MNRLLLGCILLAVSWTASAADITLYKVELIVFENLDPSAPQAEDWPADPGTPSLNNAMELDTLPEAPPPAAEPTLSLSVGYHLAGFIPVTLIGLYYAWSVGFRLRTLGAEVETALEEDASDVSTPSPG